MAGHPYLPTTLLFIGVAFILVILNAFFVAAEFAIVKVRRTRLEELAGQGVAAARISLLCVDQLDEYLSATQLGITMVSLGLGWIGEEAFYNLLVILFPTLLTNQNSTIHFIAAGFSFLLITMLHVVLGELVPKNLAIQKAEQVTLRVSRPLELFHRATRPLIQVFAFMANLVLRQLRLASTEEPPLSEEELKLVMKESREEGVITESEAQIIARAFHFSDKYAQDLMIRGDAIEYLSLSKTVEENLSVTRRRMHTRFPLCQDGLQSIIGIVHMKDAWPLLAETRSNDALIKVARSVVYVDALTRQDQLLKTFRERRAHMAVVQDHQTKANIGIVTMEDILEELIGPIRDEHGN